jgi:hypothetical protein
MEIKPRNGLIELLPTEEDIKQLAYDKFCKGSNDSIKNWLDAERELNHIKYKVQHTTQYDYNI